MDAAQRAEQILVESEAILRGDHFVYVTGEHGDGWVAKDAVFPHTDLVDELCGLLAEAVTGRELDYVVGPATGGLIVAQWTARHLGIPALFAEHAKEEGYVPEHAGEGPLRAPFVLRRGYDEAVRGKRVLVVVTAACLCTRGNAEAGDVGCDDFVWLTEVRVPSWPAADCPLCREGVPVNTRYAHGSDFLAQQGAT